MARCASISRMHIEGTGEADTAIQLYTEVMADPKADGLHLKETLDAFDRLPRPDLAIKASILLLTTNKTDKLKKMPSVIRRLETAGKKRRGRVF